MLKFKISGALSSAIPSCNFSKLKSRPTTIALLVSLAIGASSPVSTASDANKNMHFVHLMQSAHLAGDNKQNVKAWAVRTAAMRAMKLNRTPDEVDATVRRVEKKWDELTAKIEPTATDRILFGAALVATGLLGGAVAVGTAQTVGVATGTGTVGSLEGNIWEKIYAGPNAGIDASVASLAASYKRNSTRELMIYAEAYSTLDPGQQNQLCQIQNSQLYGDNLVDFCGGADAHKSEIKKLGLPTLPDKPDAVTIAGELSNDMEKLNNHTNSRSIPQFAENMAASRADSEKNIEDQNAITQNAIQKSRVSGEDLKASIRSGVNELKSGQANILEIQAETREDIKNGFLTSVKNQEEIRKGVRGNSVKLDTLLKIEENREKQARKKAIENTLNIADRKDLRASANLGITALSYIDPVVANRVGAIVEASFKISDALDAYQAVQAAVDAAEKAEDIANAAGAIGKLGAAALTYDLVSVGITLFTAFSDTGPTPDQIMLEQLGEIRLQLVDIQEQLGDISVQIDEGFDNLLYGIDKLQQGQRVTLDEIEDTIQIGLDIQRIVKAESSRIYDAVLGVAYRPCVIAMQNSQNFNGADYNWCAYQLYDMATNSVYSDEIDVSSYGSAESIKLALSDPSSAGRTASSVRDYYSKISGTRFFGDIASFENWRTTMQLYTNFLLTYPELAKDAFRSGNIGTDIFRKNVQAIRDFRGELLNALEAYEPGGSEHPFADIDKLYVDRYQAMMDLFESEIGKYNTANGTNLSHALLTRYFNDVPVPQVSEEGLMSFDEIDSTFGEGWSAANIVLHKLDTTGDGVELDHENFQLISEDMKGRLLADVPADMWKLLAVDPIGTLDLRITRNGAATIQSFGCGFSTCHRILSVPYDIRLDVMIDGEPTRVSTYKVRVAPNSWDSRIDSTPEAQWRRTGCITQSCFNSAFNSATKVEGSYESSLNQWVSVYKGHKNAISDIMEISLLEMSNDESTGFSDQAVSLQSGYFGALYRNAFPYSEEHSDVINALANNQYTFPTTKDLVKAAKGNLIFDIPFALLNEYTSLTTSIDEATTQTSIDTARIMIDLTLADSEIDAVEEYIFGTKATNSDTYVDNTDSTEEVVVVNDATNSDCDYSSADMNDGWGWNPVTGQSCEPKDVVITTANDCDYSQADINDGWGWNAVTGQSCEPIDTVQMNDQGSCDYTRADIQDGWGWNPETLESCPPITVSSN